MVFWSAMPCYSVCVIAIVYDKVTNVLEMAAETFTTTTVANYTAKGFSEQLLECDLGGVRKSRSQNF